ncbi:S-adenosyl-L-methionine-dependent methyltransferase, partial [Trichodelitschia bisporula]
WNDLWASSFTPWDRAGPSPALADTLSQKADLLGQPAVAGTDGSTTRARALVPGCGRGYDVLLLASAGYDAWGLDSSGVAVGEAERYAAEAGNDEGIYPLINPEVGRGAAHFLEGDFYARNWEAGITGLAEDGGFDLIYDYTFLCAMNPPMRPAWASRMRELLRPGGVLVCLEFPTAKTSLSEGGPPWACPSALHRVLLGWPGEEVPYSDGVVVESPGRAKSEKALTQLGHWKAERTHAGQGTDWVSVWRR